MTSNLFDLKGKVAVITGSSRGIGKAIAQQMAAHGAKVVISSRKQAACDEVAGEINTEFGANTAIAKAASLSSKDDLAHLVEHTKTHFGQIDILVCNAATNPHFGPMSTVTDEQFQKTLMNNIVSNHWLINMVAPGMRQQKDGAVIIISSIGGLYGSDVIGVYNISKAGDIQMARNLALEFGADNIRVNCIAPGLIKTDFAKALWQDPTILKNATSGSCLKRIGEPDEIAGVAVMLASKAGSFCTGQTFVVDGGRMAI
jgi:NAD(P)-dependent dehydrogenase (short-subunit alcohol dehydrogenase family)